MTAEEAYQKEIHEGRLMIKMHQELESLRQENSRLRERMNQLTDDYEGTIKRLREALEKIACWKFETVPGLIPWPVNTAREALNPPKRS